MDVSDRTRACLRLTESSTDNCIPRRNAVAVGGGAGLDLSPLVLAPMADEEERHDNSGDQPCIKKVDRLLRSPGHEPQAHDHENVHDGQHRKRITEGAMDYMPKMKHAMRVIQEDQSP